MNDLPVAAEVRDTPLAEALGDRYLAYAMSTIMARSLPDVRDGLKPVHRRLLYAMRQLRLDPDAGFKKCARVVGDVIGKYHPHGDAAVYEALVRLAQSFAVRYPLVDGQGNFGNIDGDGAAAMRYTEARLTEVANALLEGIDEDAVDFRATYDGEEHEPVVLPSSFPNLLANGASGIAVGMASSIPPHNVGEICDALQHLIKHPGASIDKLVELMSGPDFPTGGVLVEPHENLVQAYTTGRGSFRVRARWEVEKLKGGTWQIVVTEMPYQVPKARLIERIAELLAARKLPMLADVRDESTDDVRLVLEPRSRNVEPGTLMEALFRATDLEVRFGLNMNVLDAEHTPRVMSLREVLQAFLDHRHEVLIRRSRYRLDEIERRIEVLEGYLVAYLNIDEVIRIIREEDEPKAEMMARWDLTEIQADAILNMRLRALRKLEEIRIRDERDALSAERDDITALLGDEARRWKTVSWQIGELRAQFGPETPLGRRRTHHGEAPRAEVVSIEAMIEREPVTVLCSEKGWIRTVKGHIADDGATRYKEGDKGRFVIHAQTTDKLVVVGSNGRCYTIGVERLPGGRGQGEPVRLHVDMPNDVEPVAMFVHVPGQRRLLASSDGRGFLVKEDDVIAQTRNGRQVMNLADGAAVAGVEAAEGDHMAVLGTNRKLLVFPLAEVPEMGRGRGVILQRYANGALADVRVFTLDDGLPCRQGDRTRTFTREELGDWLGRRAQAGRAVPKGFPKANRF